MSETRPTADDLKRLNDEVARLRRELWAAEEAQSLATLAYWGCKIGDPVREARTSKGLLGAISSVERGSGSTRSKPWITVRLNKKDGTPGERIVNFYGDWERVEDAASDAA